MRRKTTGTALNVRAKLGVVLNMGGGLKSRRSNEEVDAALRRIEELRAQGVKKTEAIRKAGLHPSTYYLALKARGLSGKEKLPITIHLPQEPRESAAAIILRAHNAFVAEIARALHASN